MTLRRAVSHVVSSVLLIVIVVVIAIGLYAVITSYPSRMSSAASNAGADIIGVDCVTRLPSGGLRIFVRNCGTREVTISEVYIINPASDEVLLTYHTNATIRPGRASAVTIPSIYLTSVEEKGIHKVRIKLSAVSGTTAYSVTLPEIKLQKSKVVCLGLRAIRDSVRNNHWLVFNFVTGEYVLYDNTSGVVSGPYRGIAPILKGVSKYTITTSWVSWDDRPIDSPIVIVMNPTNANRDWAFTWRDAHGTYRFYLQRLTGDKEADFLVFWEDIFDPYHPRSLDDWKDHVARVTVFTNGTYRVAVYMAKGGYSHEFYLNVTSENPLVGNLVYQKPFGAYWSSYSGGYYREIPDKIFIIHG